VGIIVENVVRSEDVCSTVGVSPIPDWLVIRVAVVDILAKGMIRCKNINISVGIGFLPAIVGVAEVNVSSEIVI
jgi:hypothetical protein